MFIQNRHGEIVNTEAILAIKVCDDKAPYQINIFTEKTETIFQFDSQTNIQHAMNKLENCLTHECMIWVECENWIFRSDKILAINDEPCRNLTVSMVGKDFHVYTGAKDDDTLMEVKRQIAASLSENFFNSDRPVFVRLT